MLEFQKGNDIVLQAELERREMMANQERRELAERQNLERRRRDAEMSVGELLTMRNAHGRAVIHR